LGWLLFAIRLHVRSLKVALVIAPLVIIAYVLGLPYGPTGVALSYSVAMTLWLIPHVIWCLHKTAISPWAVFLAVNRPLVSSAVGGIAALAIQSYVGDVQSPVSRLALAGGVMLMFYLLTLLIVMKQAQFYLDLIKTLRESSAPRQGIAQ
jgi:PST family polysaccharide transporter